MANYQRPSFVKKSTDFSIIYFLKARKFLIIKGVLEEFFQDSFSLEKNDYDHIVENIISKNPELKSCFIISKSTTFENFDEDGLSISPEVISSQLLLSENIVEVRFDLQSIRNVFLSAYDHLKTLNKLTIADNTLSIVKDKNNLYLFSGSQIISKSLKKEY